MGDKFRRANPVPPKKYSPDADEVRLLHFLSWGLEHIMTQILLAEDDDVMREYLARALDRAGYSVTSVDRGTTAVPHIDTGLFDLLLTDIVMPEMDGIELAQHCAKVAPHTQVMFITGFAAVSLRAEASVPQAKLLSKPFHLKDLVREVDLLFRHKHRSHQQ